MADYNIVIGLDPILTTPCESFDFQNPPVDPIELAQDMVRIIHEHDALGLAANQIGLPYRVIALRGSPENLVCFNPKIVMPSTERISLEEACLSFPGLSVKVERPRHVRVRFTAPSGEVMTRQFTGMTARTFFHEMDHIDGKLFYNNANRYHREKALKRAKTNKLVVRQSSSIDDLINISELAMRLE
jgi:peptide deformylase